MNNVYIIILVALLLYVCIVDYYIFRIPNMASVFLSMLGIYENSFSYLMSSGILFLLFMSIKLVMDKKHKKIAVGMGDVKLASACGIFLPVYSIPQFLILCSVFGLLVRFIKNKNGYLPMGPAMCAALLFCISIDRLF